MFTLMEITRTGEAIFIDLLNIDFYFLVKVLKDEQNVLLSYGYKNLEWVDEETIDSKLPSNIREEAKAFCQEVVAYAQIDNPDFIEKLNAAGLYFDPLVADDNTCTFRP